MEFPTAGNQCSNKDCKQLDFLPFVCNHCQNTFCKEHFQMTSHECLKFLDNIKCTKEKVSSYLCSDDLCQQTSPIEMPCVKCRKHFCLAHRYHGCLEITGEEKLKKLKKWQIPKKQFADAKAVVDQQVSDTLKKSKNTTMANKVQLMKVKGSAIGPKNIPLNERCYFLVYPPVAITNKNIKPSKSTYVNVNWTFGKVIDSIADTLKIPNYNNNNTSNKLQLFHHSSGSLICSQMDTVLTELFENSTLIDGQAIILEYSNDTSVETSLYK